jgi:hypothetical protein
MRRDPTHLQARNLGSAPSRPPDPRRPESGGCRTVIRHPEVTGMDRSAIRRKGKLARSCSPRSRRVQEPCACPAPGTTLPERLRPDRRGRGWVPSTGAPGNGTAARVSPGAPSGRCLPRPGVRFRSEPAAPRETSSNTSRGFIVLASAGEKPPRGSRRPDRSGSTESTRDRRTAAEKFRSRSATLSAKARRTVRSEVSTRKGRSDSRSRSATSPTEGRTSSRVSRSRTATTSWRREATASDCSYPWAKKSDRRNTTALRFWVRLR